MAKYTIGICFESAKNTKASECFFTGFQRSLWKFSTTGNLYTLKSWLWLAAVACVVRWSISNALLNDIWLTCSTWMCNWNYWHKHLKWRLLKPRAANHCPCDYSSQGQFVRLDMFVNGLAVTCRSGLFHSALCLSRGRAHVLAFLHLNNSRHCCI